MQTWPFQIFEKVEGFTASGIDFKIKRFRELCLLSFLQNLIKCSFFALNPSCARIQIHIDILYYIRTCSCKLQHTFNEMVRHGKIQILSGHKTISNKLQFLMASVICHVRIKSIKMKHHRNMPVTSCFQYNLYNKRMWPVVKNHENDGGGLCDEKNMERRRQKKW